MAGGYTFIFWIAFCGFLGCCELLSVLQTWWLGFWAQQYETRAQEDINVF